MKLSEDWKFWYDVSEYLCKHEKYVIAPYECEVSFERGRKPSIGYSSHEEVVGFHGGIELQFVCPNFSFSVHPTLRLYYQHDPRHKKYDPDKLPKLTVCNSAAGSPVVPVSPDWFKIYSKDMEKAEDILTTFRLLMASSI